MRIESEDFKTLKIKILELLSDGKERYAKEVAKELNAPSWDVVQAIKKLGDEGLINNVWENNKGGK